ncbi:helix-turn-helix transcriptional regulator [Uliginosibacterium flavum]|uniref:Helix-turn-helix domain-containing protein n=1 Tax=Uliginosibacterium flavum TaxID=1396831 RepID=A0ABV2TNR0_9RHOO
MQALLNIKELARCTGLAVQTIYNRLNTCGDLPPAIRLGRSLRWREEDVEYWISTKVEFSSSHKQQGFAAPLSRRKRS